ncbi:MAG: hypothetical protein RL711_1862 [Bacteroidota bacterium]
MSFNKNTFLHENKTFEKIDFANQVTQNKEFEQCTFKHCDFSQRVLANNVFSDCSFVNCNLSNVNFNNASLKNVAFKDCKLLGIIFSEVKDFLFNIHLENCNADFASFANKKMSKTKFINTSLKDVNFAGSVLNNALFDNCNLENALFIEKELGRIRHKRWTERTIDIDILYFNDDIIDSASLTVPHPEIQNRRFTLVPMCEISPDFIHPIFNQTQTELLKSCGDELKVWKQRVKGTES